MTNIVERLNQARVKYFLDNIDLRAEVERLRHENMRLQTANEYAYGPKGSLRNCVPPSLERTRGPR